MLENTQRKIVKVQSKWSRPWVPGFRHSLALAIMLGDTNVGDTVFTVVHTWLVSVGLLFPQGHQPKRAGRAEVGGGQGSEGP